MVLTPRLRCESFSLRDSIFWVQLFKPSYISTAPQDRRDKSLHRPAVEFCSSETGGDRGRMPLVVFGVSITEPFSYRSHNAQSLGNHTVHCPAKRPDKAALGLQLRVPCLASTLHTAILKRMHSAHERHIIVLGFQPF